MINEKMLELLCLKESIEYLNNRVEDLKNDYMMEKELESDKEVLFSAYKNMCNTFSDKLTLENKHEELVLEFIQNYKLQSVKNS